MFPKSIPISAFSVQGPVPALIRAAAPKAPETFMSPQRPVTSGPKEQMKNWEMERGRWGQPYLLCLYIDHTVSGLWNKKPYGEERIKKTKKKNTWSQWTVCWRFDLMLLCDNYKAHCCHLVMTLQLITVYKVQQSGGSAIWTKKDRREELSIETCLRGKVILHTWIKNTDMLSRKLSRTQ